LTNPLSVFDLPLLAPPDLPVQFIQRHALTLIPTQNGSRVKHQSAQKQQNSNF
jgi:hypothetical protein